MKAVHEHEDGERWICWTEAIGKVSAIILSIYAIAFLLILLFGSLTA